MNYRALSFVVVWFAALIVAVSLAGCSSWKVFGESDPPPPLTMVIPEPTTAKAPAECSTSGDPKWKNLAESDVPRSEAARNYKANKEQFRKLTGKRAVCGDALKAQGLL